MDEPAITGFLDVVTVHGVGARSARPSTTEALLAEVKAAVEREKRPYRGKDKIALRVGKLINRYKVGKHFELQVGEDSFSFSRKQAQVAAEAALDGIYVVRTSAPHTEGLSPAERVKGYKDLEVNEAGFKSLKTVDLEVRPIFHWTEARVRAHVFICMLALYLVWHLRRAWAPLCFADEAPPERTDPVAPARRSDGALAKVSRHTDEAGETLHSFSTLLDEPATLTRNVIVFTNGARITKLAIPTALQRRAFELVGVPVPIELKAM